MQRQVARQIGVDESTLFNWESNETLPAIRHVPGIIRFLGYNPFPEPMMFSEKPRLARTGLGLSQRLMASRLGVDPTTLGFWERSERTPSKKLLARLEKSLLSSIVAKQSTG